MRDTRDRGRRPVPEPRRQLPPLSPPGFATDVTPRTKHVSLAARGAAVLRRGSFEQYLQQHDPHGTLGPGQKKAIQILRTNRHDLLKPENQPYLSALQRAEPGTKLWDVIHADSRTAHQHTLLKAGLSVPPSTRLHLQRSGLTDDQIDRNVAGELSATDALTKMHEHKVAQAQADIPRIAKQYGVNPQQVKVDSLGNPLVQQPPGWTGKLLSGAMNTVIGTAPFLYHMATTDPRKSIPQLGEAVGHSFKETVTHPIRQFQQDPFSMLMNVTAPVGAGAGLMGRGAAAAEAANVARTGVTEGVRSIAPRIAEQAAQMSPARAAVHGFTHPEVKSLIETYESKAPGAADRIARQEADIVDQLKETAGAPTFRRHGVANRFKGTVQGVRYGIQATRVEDRAARQAIIDRNIHFVGPAGARLGVNMMAGTRELLDGVRAGTIYLRPAYLPNNWAGNLFMNLTHQGFLAPINLAKSMMMHRSMTTREMNMLRTATGQTAIAALHGTGRGYVRAFTDPVAHAMGRVADQPFRDSALFHELRGRGYKSIADVKALARAADNGDEVALSELAKAGRAAQEEIVKFTKMNDVERHVLRQVFFVWNWTKGATRYAARFPLAHPIQSAVYTAGAKMGNADVQGKIGGLPPYLVGSIPVGHGRLSNPFALNPLGTAVQAGQAIHGTAQELRPEQFGHFDPHTGTDLSSLLHPAFQAWLQSREQVGGRSYMQNVLRNIAPYSLYHGLAHPGSGGIFPGTRWEAVGHYVLGSLYPRKYDPEALQSALERMNINHPEALIPGMVKRYEEKTGQKMPKELVTAYRKDLEELQAQKDFKSHFATSHNAPSYRRLPPANQAEGALKYLEDNHILPASQLSEFRTAISQIQSDDEAKAITSALWAATNVGHAKRTWQELMAVTKQGHLTRKR